MAGASILPEDCLFILLMEQAGTTVPFPCLFAPLFEILLNSFPGRPGIILCFAVFPQCIDYMFLAASAVNVNHGARLWGNLGKQPASLAVRPTFRAQTEAAKRQETRAQDIGNIAQQPPFVVPPA